MLIVFSIIKSFIPVLLIGFILLKHRKNTLFDMLLALSFAFVSLFVASIIQSIIPFQNSDSVLFKSFIESSLIEEVSKGISLFVLFKILYPRTVKNNDMQKIIELGFFLGLCFASFETLRYSFDTTTLFFRFFTSHVIHSFGSLILVFGLCYKKKAFLPPASFIFIVLVHGLFNLGLFIGPRTLFISFIVEIILLSVALYAYKNVKEQDVKDRAF